MKRANIQVRPYKYNIDKISNWEEHEKKPGFFEKAGTMISNICRVTEANPAVYADFPQPLFWVVISKSSPRPTVPASRALALGCEYTLSRLAVTRTRRTSCRRGTRMARS